MKLLTNEFRFNFLRFIIKVWVKYLNNFFGLIPERYLMLYWNLLAVIIPASLGGIISALIIILLT